MKLSRLPIILILAVGFSLQGKAQDTPFVPATFEYSETYQFEAAPKLVCPLWAPEWRSLAIDWWVPVDLVSPPGDTLAGQVQHVKTDHHPPGTGILSKINRQDSVNTFTKVGACMRVK